MHTRMVETDTKNYLISYWCDEYSGFPRVWIHTLGPEPVDMWKDYIQQRVTALFPNLDQSTLHNIRQNSSSDPDFDCHYDMAGELVQLP